MMVSLIYLRQVLLLGTSKLWTVFFSKTCETRLYFEGRESISNQRDITIHNHPTDFASVYEKCEVMVLLSHLWGQSL